MKVEKSTMNWLPRPSAYDEAVAQKQKRKVINESFLNNSASLASMLGDLRTSSAVEQGNIVARIAQARINKKA